MWHGACFVLHLAPDGMTFTHSAALTDERGGTASLLNPTPGRLGLLRDRACPAHAPSCLVGA